MFFTSLMFSILLMHFYFGKLFIGIWINLAAISIFILYYWKTFSGAANFARLGTSRFKTGSYNGKNLELAEAESARIEKHIEKWTIEFEG